MTTNRQIVPTPEMAEIQKPRQSSLRELRERRLETIVDKERKLTEQKIEDFTSSELFEDDEEGLEEMIKLIRTESVIRIKAIKHEFREQLKIDTFTSLPPTGKSLRPSAPKMPSSQLKPPTPSAPSFGDLFEFISSYEKA